MAWLITFPDDKPAIITGHALERFWERWPEVQRRTLFAEKTREELEDLIANSFPEELPEPYRSERLRRNDGRETFYYRRGKWRFVVVRDNDLHLLATIEIAKKLPR